MAYSVLKVDGKEGAGGAVSEGQSHKQPHNQIVSARSLEGRRSNSCSALSEWDGITEVPETGSHISPLRGSIGGNSSSANIRSKESVKAISGIMVALVHETTQALSSQGNLLEGLAAAERPGSRPKERRVGKKSRIYC